MSSLTGLCAVNYQLAFFQELNETGPSVNIEISTSNSAKYPRKTVTRGFIPGKNGESKKRLPRAKTSKLIKIRAMNRLSKSQIHKDVIWN
jgi:hypothetical protein